jgi:hypothetical protein
MQLMTFLINFSLPQKQFESVESLQSVTHSQVFKQRGKVSGQCGCGTEAGEVLDAVAPVSVSVTGQTVVDTAVVAVTTTVESAGQFVTVGAQEVFVITVVDQTVEVV